MIDIKILTIMDLLPITTVQYANGILPVSIVITGSSLDQTTTVLINDMASPEFMILSPTRIIAQVPTSQANSVIYKVAAVAEVPSVNRRSILSFEVGSGITPLKGLEKLVQCFCRMLLQSPGSDRFNPTEGGGLLKIVGRNVSKGDTGTLQAAVVGAVGRTKDQIMSRQGTDSRIPSDERLLTATAEAVGFDPSSTTLTARVVLSAVSGHLAVTNLTL